MLRLLQSNRIGLPVGYTLCWPYSRCIHAGIVLIDAMQYCRAGQWAKETAPNVTDVLNWADILLQSSGKLNSYILGYTRIKIIFLSVPIWTHIVISFHTRVARFSVRQTAKSGVLYGQKTPNENLFGNCLKSSIFDKITLHFCEHRRRKHIQRCSKCEFWGTNFAFCSIFRQVLWKNMHI